jgi:hypothetical protein
MSVKFCTIVGAVVLAAARGRILQWPDLDLGLRTFWYALRTHGEIISGSSLSGSTSSSFQPF